MSLKRIPTLEKVRNTYAYGEVTANHDYTVDGYVIATDDFNNWLDTYTREVERDLIHGLIRLAASNDNLLPREILSEKYSELLDLLA